jgi:K+-transporting ATPase ATPase A chain
MVSINDILQIFIYLGLLTVLIPVLGNYMFRVFTGEKHFMVPVMGRVEKFVYKIAGINKQEESDWKGYALDLLLFNLAGLLFLFLVQILQSVLPLNPAGLTDIKWYSALNTAISFITNTNWQGYTGETTVSYFVQMTGLTVQNFVSAGTGIAVMLALVRGISGSGTNKLGNFRVDLTRSVIYVLLPLSVLLAVVLVSQGVIQNFKPYITVYTLQDSQQVIPMGPAASQIAIKQLGTNGGGYFNANSAHPFENPTPVSNFIEMLAILLIPASLTYTYGRMAGSTRHGWIIFIVMMLLFMAGLTISLKSELSPNPAYGNIPVMEGKEIRFGIASSVMWSVSTTAASNGSVNAMHDSLSPIAGMIALVNIMLGEIVFGGVGSGMYGMVLFIILTVFIAGLMVGRTPEYRGKKVGRYEIQMAIIAIFATNIPILIFTAWASVSHMGLSGVNNPGPHGFSEILYAYSSATGNNGSAFAGLFTNTPFYNITLGIAMLIGRFGVIIPVLATAGSLANRIASPPSTGSLQTDNWLFVVLLTAIILIIGGLTHFTSLLFGPVAEQLLMKNNYLF